MPATQLAIAETAHGEQLDPNLRAELLARPGRGVRREERSRRLRIMASLLRRVPRTAASYHDPLFRALDVVENDYYRFQHQPRG